MTYLNRILHLLAQLGGFVGMISFAAATFGALYYRHAGYDNIAEMCISLILVSAITVIFSILVCLRCEALARARRDARPAPFCHVGDPL